MPIRTVIFDLDGTILLNEPAYCVAFKSILASLGVKNPPACPQTIGLAIEANWAILLKKYRIKTNKTPQMLTQDTQTEYLKHLDEISPAPHLYQLITDLKSKDWFVALATSNFWWLVEKELAHFHLEDKFDTITTREEVFFPKPAPDIFIKTANKLKVAPQNCIVIENSVVGIQAAVAAGMKAIAVISAQQTKPELISAGAHLTIASLAELSPSRLSALVSSKN